jgi:hypothetical protein
MTRLTVLPPGQALLDVLAGPIKDEVRASAAS